MTANLRVFLSSTCNDLFQERRDIARAILDMGHAVILSDQSESIPVHPNLSAVNNCLEAIRSHVDLVVLVISGSYGSTDSDGRSITLKEYLEARSRRIPVITFVRQKVWDLLPVYRRQPSTNFDPIVTDNRVFQLLDRVVTEHQGNWVFPYFEAAGISDTLRYQFSCLLRAELRDVPPTRGELIYEYVNNYSVMLASDGLCYRALEYCVRNDTPNPVERIYGGDTSDKDFSVDQINLKVSLPDGDVLPYEITLDTPRFKRWDIVLDKPLMPGETIRYHSSWLSVDDHNMQTPQNRPVDHGFIQYVFPREFVTSDIHSALRDNTGWTPNPRGFVLRDFGCARIAFYPYRNISGVFVFRLTW
ncbi:MAG: DUF4062 domain-containing protein [Sulfuricella sp.]